MFASSLYAGVTDGCLEPAGSAAVARYSVADHGSMHHRKNIAPVWRFFDEHGSMLLHPVEREDAMLGEWRPGKAEYKVHVSSCGKVN